MTGRALSVVAVEEEHSVADVVSAVQWLCEHYAIGSVIADSDPADLPMISMPGGTFYRDQVLTERGDAAVVKILDQLHRGGGTPDHPGF